MKMLETAKKQGLASEKKMWESIASMAEMMAVMEEQHPDEFWRFMREQHGILFGNHYEEMFALYDVSKMRYTNREGKECTGAHWTPEQTTEAVKGLRLPEGTTCWDVYVALNSFYADMCQELSDDQIIRGAWRFYFKDEDAPKGKLWIYMKAMKNG
jgi:hypothetical protein